MIQLPVRKTKIKTSPNHALIYGQPKCGKTTIAAQLPSSLMIEFEDNGASFVSVNKYEPKTIQDLGELAFLINPKNKDKINALLDKENPNRSAAQKELDELRNQYHFIILDTVTQLETFVKPFANKLYRLTPMGKMYNPNADILDLPNGAGYLYLRKALVAVFEMFNKIPDLRVILLGHVKDKTINRDSTEITIQDIDLIGKNGNILGAKCDIIAHVYTNNKNSNQLMLNTKGGIEGSGARIASLANKEIVISEYDPKTSEVKTFWEQIFPDIEELKAKDKIKWERIEELNDIIEKENA